MDTLNGGKSSASEALLPVTAGEKTASGTHPTADNRQRSTSARRMACARRTIVVLSLFTLGLLWLASAGAIRMPCHKVSQDQQTPGEVLESSSFSTTSLHDLLHRYFPEKFPHGVFPSEHHATEVAQQAVDAPIVTSDVQLEKRQADNSTSSSASATPTATPTETSTPPSPTSSSTTAPPPPTSSTSLSSTSVAPPSSTSSVPPATTSRSSSSSASAPASSSSVPGTSSSLSEITLSPTTSSSGPGTSSSSAPQTLPSSSVAGETTLTTSTVPPRTTATSSRASSSRAIVETLTSTHPNGAVVTITTTTFVPADGEPSATSTRPVPTLQNSALRHYGSGPALAGAMGAAMLFLAA